jgi:hypothetical protein
MDEREITSVVWYQEDDQVDLIYAEGEPDRLVGTRTVVAELAENLGLVVVATPPGTIRWGQPSQTP